MGLESRRIAHELGELIRRKVVEVALEISAEETIDTPRDTSFAANEWHPIIGTDVPSVPTPAGREARAGAALLARADKAAAEIAFASGYRPELGPASVVNGAAYIGRLNDGHSPQAPAGFVERAAERAIAQVAARP